MIEAWRSISEGQGAVISAILTMFAAIIGVVLGAILFGRRVSDLKGAVEETERIVQEHKAQVSQAFEEIQNKIAGVDAQLASTLQNMGSLISTVNDTQDASHGENDSENRSAWKKNAG